MAGKGDLGAKGKVDVVNFISPTFEQILSMTAVRSRKIFFLDNSSRLVNVIPGVSYYTKQDMIQNAKKILIYKDPFQVHSTCKIMHLIRSNCLLYDLIELNCHCNFQVFTGLNIFSLMNTPNVESIR